MHGSRRDTGAPLYNLMPTNGRIALNHASGRWNSTLELEGVRAKSRVSPVRNEVPTPGYGLVHWRAAYRWKHVRLDAGVQNLLDRHHALPLGGVYLGQERTMAINGVPYGIAVPGPGRSVHMGVTVDF